MQVQIKSSEIALLCFVSLMALAANLPDSLTGNLVDRNLLLVTLTVTVIISLFRYLRLMLFISVSILAIGANLPDQLASQLGVSRPAMIIFSGLIVFIALLYKYLGFKLSGNPEDQKIDTMESRDAVILAILKRNLAALHQLLTSNVNVNFSQNGCIPIFLAIENGFADVVLVLISHGVKLRVKNSKGITPMEMALLHDDIRIAKIIYYASKQGFDIKIESQNTVKPIISAMPNTRYLVAD